MYGKKYDHDIDAGVVADLLTKEDLKRAFGKAGIPITKGNVRRYLNGVILDQYNDLSDEDLDVLYELIDGRNAGR